MQFLTLLNFYHQVKDRKMPDFLQVIVEQVETLLAQGVQEGASLSPVIVQQMKYQFFEAIHQMQVDDLKLYEALFMNLYNPFKRGNYQNYQTKSDSLKLKFIQDFIDNYHRYTPTFQFVSDLHLEMPHKEEDIPQIPANADHLILLGDIGNPFAENYQNFIDTYAGAFKQVYIVAGNHEYYRNSIPATNAKLRELAMLWDNVHFLDHDVIDVPDSNIRLLGCTLWTSVAPEHVSSMQFMMNDYRVIFTDNEKSQRLTVHNTNQMHAASVVWLQTEIANAKSADKDVIVCTHHAPTIEHAIPDENFKEDDFVGSMSGTDLHHLFRRPLKAWLFGHSHYNCDFFASSYVRVASNQLGYASESIGFQPEKTLLI